jgi:hypothetical protein
MAAAFKTAFFFTNYFLEYLKIALATLYGKKSIKKPATVQPLWEQGWFWIVVFSFPNGFKVDIKLKILNEY